MTERPEAPETEPGRPETTGRAEATGRLQTDLGIHGLTEEILPALIARLRASRLAELEVRTADWRVRLRRDLRSTRRATSVAGVDGTAPSDADDAGSGITRSPAVGYFSPLPQLSVGQLVQAGDPLGSVDVLGIAQDVLSPAGGIVRALLAEPGQAVEYGQPLVEIDVLAVELEDIDAAVGEVGATTSEPEQTPAWTATEP